MYFDVYEVLEKLRLAKKIGVSFYSIRYLR